MGRIIFGHFQVKLGVDNRIVSAEGISSLLLHSADMLMGFGIIAVFLFFMQPIVLHFYFILVVMATMQSAVTQRSYMARRVICLFLCK